jgi:hypothetical protein
MFRLPNLGGVIVVVGRLVGGCAGARRPLLVPGLLRGGGVCGRHVKQVLRLLHQRGQPGKVFLEQGGRVRIEGLQRGHHLPQLPRRLRRQVPRDGVEGLPGDEARGVDGVFHADGMVVALAAAVAALPAGEADAEVAAAQEMAVQVAEGAARRLVVGVLHEGVAPALAGGGIGGDVEGEDGANEITGVAKFLLAGMEWNVPDVNNATASAVGGGCGQLHGEIEDERAPTIASGSVDGTRRDGMRPALETACSLYREIWHPHFPSPTCFRQHACYSTGASNTLARLTRTCINEYLGRCLVLWWSPARFILSAMVLTVDDACRVCLRADCSAGATTK